MHAVLAQQDALWLVLITGEANVCLWLLQAEFVAIDRRGELAGGDGVLGHVLVGAGFQWHRAVEELATPFDDLVAADLVVSLALFRSVFFGDGVGAVEGVVQRTPASVGRVEGKAGVEDGNHQLRAGGGGDLGVDVFRFDLKVTWVFHQVADLLQERGVLLGVLLTLVGGVPLVQLGLQLIALGQQLSVAGSKFLHQLAEAVPENILLVFAFATDAGQHFVIHEVI